MSLLLVCGSPTCKSIVGFDVSRLGSEPRRGAATDHEIAILRANYQDCVSSLSRQQVVGKSMRGNSLPEARIGDNVGVGSVGMTFG